MPSLWRASEGENTMIMLRSRVLRKNIALGVVASFFLQSQIVTLSNRDTTRSVKSNSELVKLDYSEQATLKPFLSDLIAKEQVSEDVRRCADSVRKGLSLEANVVLRALPDLMYHIFTAKDEMRRSVKTKADLVSSSDRLRDVLSAMRALNKVGESLSRNESLSHSADFKYVMQALEDFLGDLPAGNVDDLVDFLRFVGDPTGLGIRQILVKMASCIDELVPCCQTVSSKLDECCFAIISKLDNLAGSPCAPTPVFGQTTLSASGTYCLANDVTSASGATIVISGVYITLDLNGHNVASASSSNPTGISVTGRHVVVKNGSVSNLFAGEPLGTGIAVTSTAQDVVIEDVFVTNWNFGILISGADTVVSRSDIYGNANAGVLISSPAVSTSVKNSKMHNNVLDELAINGAGNTFVGDCVFNVNNRGIRLTGATCAEILNCQANNSTVGVSIGYLVENGSGILFNNCSACGFNQGFNTVGTAQVSILNSVAKNNTHGFKTDAGSGILRNNTADSNTTSGFNNGGSYQFYSNTACFNGTNFIGVTSAPITSPANARGVKNVDCTNVTPDQVTETLSHLDQCCFTINSRLDELAAVSIEDCCFTLNSKVDQVAAADAACCFTINSKLDGLAEGSFDNCCFTLNSKVDQLAAQDAAGFFTVNSKLDGLAEISIEDCCFTLNSKIDVLGACNDASFDSCCFTSTCDIDNSCLTVIQWLKTIYRDIRGFVTPNISDCGGATGSSCLSTTC